MGKDTLYFLIFKRLKTQSAPEDLDELKLRIATVVYDYNKITLEIEGKFGRDTAVVVADNYINDLEFFLLAMGVIPKDFDGDFVKEIVHPQDRTCQCIFALLHLFWKSSQVAEEFIAKRLARH